MFKEMTNEEMMQVDGGGFAIDYVAGKAIDFVIKKIASTPYERNVHRGGKVYHVSYDGNYSGK